MPNLSTFDKYLGSVVLVNTRQNRYMYTCIFLTFACVNNSVNIECRSSLKTHVTIIDYLLTYI